MKEGISRSRTDKIFGGVAAGLGEYLQIDPIVVRTLFVVSVLFSGVGILVYLIMWIVIPEEKFIYNNAFDNPQQNTSYTNQDVNLSPDENINHTFYDEKKRNGNTTFGVVLIIIGVFFLGVKIFSFLNFEDIVPIVLVAGGIILLWRSKK